MPNIHDYEMAAVGSSNELFKRISKKKVTGYPIAAIFRKTSKKGDIGLELEFEGSNLPKAETPDNPWGPFKSELIPKEWGYHHDGSLRGENGNAEYVLAEPVKFEELEGALDNLWDMFSKAGTVLEESNRTSVHVHLNAQTWHLNRVTSFLAIYFCLEDILTKWCGDYRVGNMFCMRARDAAGIIQNLKKFIKEDGNKSYLPDGMHYAGLNCHALGKFGSIEVRSLRGVSDKQTVLEWVAILKRLYELSGEFKDPRSVCAEFSSKGPLEYFNYLLGDLSQTVLQGCNMDNQEIMQSMYDGIRLAQDICYCRDWSLYEPLNLDPDPFGRDVRVVQQQIEAYSSEEVAAPNLTGNGLIYNTSLIDFVTSWPEAEEDGEEEEETWPFDEEEDDYE